MELHETVTACQTLRELSATLWQPEHVKRGAKLVWLDRADENMTFAAAFPTAPQDDTGVFHILEHSVLCGSERYPVKELYAELMKGSMATFMNAMTFPDKPVAVANCEKSFCDDIFAKALFHFLHYEEKKGKNNVEQNDKTNLYSDSL